MPSTPLRASTASGLAAFPSHQSEDVVNGTGADAAHDSLLDRRVRADTRPQPGRVQGGGAQRALKNPTSNLDYLARRLRRLRLRWARNRPGPLNQAVSGTSRPKP